MGRKRKSGEGTVRLRKDGRWEGRVVIGYDEKGLPKTKNVLAKSKGECVEKLKALKETLAPGSGWITGMKPTVNQQSAPERSAPMRDTSGCTSNQS